MEVLSVADEALTGTVEVNMVAVCTESVMSSGLDENLCELVEVATEIAADDELTVADTCAIVDVVTSMVDCVCCVCEDIEPDCLFRTAEVDKCVSAIEALLDSTVNTESSSTALVEADALSAEAEEKKEVAVVVDL